MVVMNMGTTREIVLNSRSATTKEEGKKPISPKKWKMLRRRSQRNKKSNISTMIEILFSTDLFSSLGRSKFLAENTTLMGFTIFKNNGMMTKECNMSR